MANIASEATGLIGGAATDLDFIDGSTITNGDFAFVKDSGKFYYYRANTSGGLSEDSPIVIVPDTNPGSINWELAGSNQMITIVKTANWNVSAAYLQAGVTITNTGDTGETIGTLPAGSVNDSLCCYIDANEYLRLSADGSETFRYGSDVSAAGGYIRTNEIGIFFKIEWLGGEWVITQLTGDLKYDE